MKKCILAVLLSCLTIGCQTNRTVPALSAASAKLPLTTKALKALYPKAPRGEGLCASFDSLASLDLADDARLELEAMRGVCNLPIDDVTLAQAREMLEGRDIAYTAVDNVFTLYQRGPLEDRKILRMMGRSPGPGMCCSFQSGHWRRFRGTDLWVMRLRLRGLEAATIYQQVGRFGDDTPTTSIKYRGPMAPPVAAKSTPLIGRLETFSLTSPQLKEVRKFGVYTPPNVATLRDLPVIVMADGVGRNQAELVEALILAGKIRPVLLVGMIAGNEGIDGPPRPIPSYVTRFQDYTPSQENSTFQPHLAFVVDTVKPWIEARYPASKSRTDWAVSGSSQGGTFAVNVGLFRPDIFGHAWPMSIAGDAVNLEAFKPTPERARFRISAGFYEMSFLQNSQKAASGLTELGGDIYTQWYSDGHNPDQWETALASNLIAVFPARVR